MKFEQMNLMLVMVDRDCNGECDESPQPSAPEEDILFECGVHRIDRQFLTAPLVERRRVGVLADVTKFTF